MRRRNDVASVRHGNADKADVERVGKLHPNVKVSMAVNMTEAVVRVCLAGIKAQNPKLTDDEVMERLRERFEWAKKRRAYG